MRIIAARIENYKSFRDSGEINFSAGFNTIIGRNNSGKTALLEAISNKFSTNPHISHHTLPNPGSQLRNPYSHVETTIDFPTDSFLELAITNGRRFTLAVNKMDNPIISPSTYLETHLRSSPFVRFTISMDSGLQPKVSLVNDLGDTNPSQAITVLMDDLTDLPYIAAGSDVSSADASDSGPHWILPEVQSRIYHFKAERMALGRATGIETPNLDPDARNLTLCLKHLLNDNRFRFSRLVHLSSLVLPEITDISFRPIGTMGEYETRVLFVDPELERSDLAIPLADCGTGIGQVLAMLYVAITAKSQQVILVDEPQSFLHPGALRKLIQILRSEQSIEHQYIFSTHTPQIVSDVASSSIHLVSRGTEGSQIKQLSAQDADHKKLLLTDLGIQMSDVLTSERILWVEGPTESSALPLIIDAYQHFGSKPLPMIGTSVLPLSATGDLEGRNMDSAARIYEAVTAGISFVPPALAFIIDSELRTDEQKDKIERTFNRRVHWLKRRMYENYLLHPEALSKLILNFPDTPQDDATPEAIQQRLQELLGSIEFYHGQAPKLHDDRLRMVHGANVLDKLVRDTMGPDKGYNYKTQKVSFGTELTKYILEIQPSALQEVYDLLASALNESSANGETSSIA